MFASKIPGATGEMFGKAYEGVAGFQDNMNLMLTGNKSQTALGMVYDVHTQGDKASTWMDQKTQEVAKQRNEYVTRPVEVTGDIGVKAEPGSQITRSSFSANAGANMFPLGGAFR